MPTYTSQYPPLIDDLYIRATSNYVNYSARFATDPSKPLTGGASQKSWLSANGGAAFQRYHIDIGSAKIIKRLYYENFHNSGLQTSSGAKTFTLWGSNSPESFLEMGYGSDAGWTQITTSQPWLDQHVAADQGDAKYITLTNSTAYRYYALKIADNWGDTACMGIRRIVLQTQDASSVDLPTVDTTSPASSITGTGAVVSAAITATGGENASARGIAFSTSSPATVEDNFVGASGYQAYGVGVFSFALSGLIPGTQYYARAYAYNSAGLAYGDEITFTTLAVPAVTTTAVSSITGTAASSGGNVTNEGGAGVTARGVCWNTTGSPTTADSKTADGSGTGVFASSLTGLTAGVTYYVRAYATNSIGTSYGAEVSFLTIAPPTVTTNSVSAITKASALVSCEIVATPGVSCTVRGICWNTTGNPTTADNKATDTGTFGTGPYNKYATGLSASTTYYARAYATNSEGTSYGAQISFTTLSVTVTVAPQLTLQDTFYLPRAGRYANPLNTNDRLPLVYGDLTDGANGNWKLPCIDTLGFVYCFAAHEVLSAANGNSITIYEEGMELNPALYTFDESNDFESEGIIATITFASPKDNAVITARGKGKPTATGGATLMENIVDIVADFLTVENNFTADLFEATYKAIARETFVAQSYKAAGVIDSDIAFWDALRQMMGSFLGSAYLNGLGELVLEIDKGTLPAESFSGIVRTSDASFIRATQKFNSLINQCPALYGKDYTRGEEWKYSTDDSAHANAISQSVYGIRKPASPYKFQWCRDLTSVQAIQDIIVAKFKDPLWEVEFDDITLKRLESDVGRFIAYSAKNIFDTDGVALLNHLWRVLSFRPDFAQSKIRFKVLQTNYYLTVAYLADGTYLADGSILAGGDRDDTDY